MSAVPISVNRVRSIEAPDELANLNGWLIWKFQRRLGEHKPRKVPYYASGDPRTGSQNALEDIEKLVDFNQAKAAAIIHGADGVGLAMRKEFNLVALDFDDCVDAGGIDPRVLELVQGTYAEVSPSGKGVRAFFKCDAEAAFETRRSNGPEFPFKVEFFRPTGFVTFTGDRLQICKLLGDELDRVTDAVSALYLERFPAAKSDKSDASMGDWSVAQRLALVEKCLKHLDPDMPEPDWVNVGRSIHHFVGDDGLDLFDSWSAGGSKYVSAKDVAGRWQRFDSAKGGTPTTIGTLIYLAEEKGASIDLSPPVMESELQPITDDAPIGRMPVFAEPIELDWDALPENPPEIPFVIPGWMPDGVVTLFAAHGGTGKSFLAIYIALCVATGKHPFDAGATIPRARVVFYSAEDNTRVLQLRMRRYMRLLGIEPDELKGWLLVLDATESENVLFAGDEKVNGRTTKRFQWLRSRIERFGAGVLIFDNASDALDANENDRAKVRQFMTALKRLASAVLLLSHVDAGSSMADPADAKGYSGSTGWHNSARSRWFMARDRDTDEVILALPKVNYAKAGGQAVIHWDEGAQVFVVAATREGRAKAVDHRDILLGMIATAMSRGMQVSHAKNSANSVFNTLKDMPGFPAGLRTHDVAAEVNRWIQAGLANVEEYTRGNRSKGSRLVLTEAGQAAAAPFAAGESNH